MGKANQAEAPPGLAIRKEGRGRRAQVPAREDERRPTCAALAVQKGAPPDLNCDAGVEAPKDVATLRLREMQLPSQRVGVGSAKGAPDDGYVVDVLGGKGVQARAIVGELAVNHGLGAVEASLLSARTTWENRPASRGPVWKWP